MGLLNNKRRCPIFSPGFNGVAEVPGTVIVLGQMGENFAAGMSGGVAYVLDLQEMLGSEKFISTTLQGCVAKEGAIPEWFCRHFGETLRLSCGFPKCI